MSKVTNYMIVIQPDITFHDHVMRLIEQGYEPTGGISVKGNQLIQALVKVDRSEENAFQTIVADQINDIHSLCVLDLQQAISRWLFLNT